MLDEDDVLKQSAVCVGRRCSPGVLSEELHAVCGETRVRSLHGHQHHHVQQNVLHTGKSLTVSHQNHGACFLNVILFKIIQTTDQFNGRDRQVSL